MKRNFFNRIADLIDGVSKKQPSEDSSSVIGDNPIDTEEKILNAILNIFNSVYKNRNKDIDNKIFTLWILDNLLSEMITKQEFSDHLITMLADEGYNTEWNAVKLEKPPLDNTFTPIINGVLMQIEKKRVVATIKDKPIRKKAKISVVNNKGALLRKVYTLDSEKQQRYNIGVGECPYNSGGSFRENHIAIDDNVDSPEYQNNKRVSRAHAYIGFCTINGFYLQVEVGGSKVHSGNRTRIFRENGNQIIELDNITLPVPLLDGDIIELGKAVCLRFKIINS